MIIGLWGFCLFLAVVSWAYIEKSFEGGGECTLSGYCLVR